MLPRVLMQFWAKAIGRGGEIPSEGGLFLGCPVTRAVMENKRKKVGGSFFLPCSRLPWTHG